jgi:hypothetical protein
MKKFFKKNLFKIIEVILLIVIIVVIVFNKKTISKCPEVNKKLGIDCKTILLAPEGAKDKEKD